MSNLIFYVNGEYVPAEQASLPVGDLGLIRGYGVFDVLRTYKRTPFQLREHVERLQRSARSILITPPWSTEQIESIVHETLARNYAANPELGDLAIRLVLTGGPSKNGFTPENRPSLMVMLIPAGPRDEELYAKGGCLITVQMDRFKPTVKSLNYIGAIMAMQQATAADAIEALYRTEDGLVTEGTRTSASAVEPTRRAASAAVGGVASAAHRAPVRRRVHRGRAGARRAGRGSPSSGGVQRVRCGRGRRRGSA